MKLQKWMELEDIAPEEVAELLRVSRSQVHKYQFEDAIPKPGMMQKIFVMTRGMVRADDFNDVSEKLFDDVNLKKFIFTKKQRTKYKKRPCTNSKPNLYAGSFRY